MRCFGRCRCDENIANNVPIAYWAVFNAVRVQDHFWEGPGLPFWFHFGDFGVTFAHRGPHRGPHVQLFRSPVCTSIFRYVLVPLLGHFGTPWPASGATCAPFLRIGAHLYFQVRFSSNLVSQGDPKKSRRHAWGTRGVMGKQHLAPLGRVPA